MIERGEAPRSWTRFYVWTSGFSVCSGWRVVGPNGSTDCTDMTDAEFEEFVSPLLLVEHEHGGPGHPGDPGLF
jgi:uncharacterized protein YbdZ (MbtH family)